jgi:hypothetical protein
MPPLPARDCLEIATAACKDSADPQPAAKVDAGVAFAEILAARTLEMGAGIRRQPSAERRPPRKDNRAA